MLKLAVQTVRAQWFKNRGHVDTSEFRKINDTL